MKCLPDWLFRCATEVVILATVCVEEADAVNAAPRCVMKVPSTQPNLL